MGWCPYPPLEVLSDYWRWSLQNPYPKCWAFQLRSPTLGPGILLQLRSLGLSRTHEALPNLWPDVDIPSFVQAWGTPSQLWWDHTLKTAFLSPSGLFTHSSLSLPKCSLSLRKGYVNDLLRTEHLPMIYSKYLKHECVFPFTTTQSKRRFST